MSENPKDTKWPKFKLAKRRQPVWSFFKTILFRPLFHCEFESMVKELPDKAIIPSIHSAKSGPMSISVSYPKHYMMWGHHGMLGNYVERFKYLRNVLYIQKLHKGKFIATLKATYEAFFSKFVYKGMKMIGTYTDMRFLQTIKNSMEVLNDNASVVIYPEDSSEGYFDEIREAFPGFVMLALTYYQKYGEDVPLLPTYVTKKKRRLIVGKPIYARELEKQGLTKQQIADHVRDEINKLYREYIATGKPVGEPTVESAPIRTREYYGE
ncbi:MAG: hypothetical protein IJE25_02115 [Clostridia bacterium]|nr:hypothetical protein [Clostridia bacterium]